MKNKLLGSALIIAGTAIGAGMIAMPLTSAKMGFSLTFFLLFILWLLLTYTALLYTEVHQYSPINSGLATLTEQYLGKYGRLFVDFLLIFFMYAVLTAYVTGSGELLFKLLPNHTHLDSRLAQQITSLIFSLFFSIIVTLGIGVSDIANRISFSLKVATFTIILFFLFNTMKISNLNATALDHRLFFSALPVFFMTFGFHICTPAINEYLQGDQKKLKQACLLGSTAVFIIYSIWQMATHGVLQQSQLVAILDQDGSLNGLIKAFEVTTGSRKISELVRVFSVLAVITSFIGVALGQISAVRDLLTRFQLKNDPITVALLTFLPPIIVGFTYPNLFLSAFAFAGLIFAFIGILLPVILAYCARKRFPDGKQIRGGNFGLVTAVFLALIIIVSYFMNKAGVLPPVVQ